MECTAEPGTEYGTDQETKSGAEPNMVPATELVLETETEPGQDPETDFSK